MKKVLGLLTCFNRKDITIAAIRALIDGNPEIVFKFIVVDDNSSDGTNKALGEIPEVTIIHGNGKMYYSGGMHKAIDAALKMKEEFAYCLLFNDDVQFFPNVVEKMIEQSKDEIVVGATCDNNGRLSYGGVIKLSKIRPRFEIIDWNSPKSEKCDTFNANCVILPWHIFKKLDNIDPIYSHSLGDFDYGFQASNRGIQIKMYDAFVGVCCDNPITGSWRDVTLSKRERIAKKESAKGLPFFEWFHYLNKNYSLSTAIIYSITPYIRIFLKK